MRFKGGTEAQPLIEALEILRELNATGARNVPDNAPTLFVPVRWQGYLDEAAAKGDATAYRHYWELPVTLDMPGKVADFLRTSELDPDERAALDQGQAVRRGQGYPLRVPAAPAIHRQLLGRCQPLDSAQSVPAQRKARREYANRVNALGNGI
ncbi:hypothetical protein ACH4TE_23940 [Streptomyces sioyaensis]|uniref:hypothetical protein n=1 Tax=Streptomyces sioyaensis TaxID=67364 RepID=UPI0037A1C1FE